MSQLNLLLVALFAVLLSACSKPTPLSKETLPDAAPVDVGVSKAATEAPRVDPQPAPEPPSTAARDALEAYILKAMKTWAPARTMPDKDDSHYLAIARDIADVVLDPHERPLWKDDTNRARTAVLVAAIGFWEGRYWKHVDDGRCNDPAWRKSKDGMRLMAVTGDCDGGWARSIYQIHPEGGIVLTDDGEWKHAWDARGAKSYSAEEMVADRRVATRIALHMVRKSLRLTGGLCGYSGEPGPCPKASQRLSFAEAWSRRHPLH